MGRKLSLEIIETAEELKELLRKQREGRLKERVQALYLLKTHQVRELKELGQVVGRDTSTLYRWFERNKGRVGELISARVYPWGTSSGTPGRRAGSS